MKEDVYDEVIEKLFDAETAIEAGMKNFCEECDGAIIDSIGMDGTDCVRKEQLCDPNGSRCYCHRSYRALRRYHAAIRDMQRDFAREVGA